MITDIPFTYTFNLSFFTFGTAVFDVFVVFVAVFFVYWVVKLAASIFTGG